MRNRAPIELLTLCTLVDSKTTPIICLASTQTPTFKLLRLSRPHCQRVLRTESWLRLTGLAAGMELIGATYQWLLRHSALSAHDGVLLGASSLPQLDSNLAACAAAVESEDLPAATLAAFDQVAGIASAAQLIVCCFRHGRSLRLQAASHTGAATPRTIQTVKSWIKEPRTMRQKRSDPLFSYLIIH